MRREVSRFEKITLVIIFTLGVIALVGLAMEKRRERNLEKAPEWATMLHKNCKDFLSNKERIKAKSTPEAWDKHFIPMFEQHEKTVLELETRWPSLKD